MARIEDFAALVPHELMNRPGEVFHSGRLAFESQSDLYILSKQSGASRDEPSSSSVRAAIERVVRHKPDGWSAFRDQSWDKREPGSAPMQKGLLHLFERLGVNPGYVPASFLVFPCAKRGEMPQAEFQQLARDCWPFHCAVIRKLSVRVIACLGLDTARWVRDRLHAHQLVEELAERNRRMWKSRTFTNSSGMAVLELTYPGVAKWTAPESDPTDLVLNALQRSRSNAN